MKKAKQITSIVLALLMLIGVFAVAPISVSAKTLNATAKANWKTIKTYLKENNEYIVNYYDAPRSGLADYKETIKFSLNNDGTITFQYYESYWYADTGREGSNCYITGLNEDTNELKCYSSHIFEGEAEYIKANVSIDQFYDLSKYRFNHNIDYVDGEPKTTDDFGNNLSIPMNQNDFGYCFNTGKINNELKNKFNLTLEDLGFGVPLVNGGSIKKCKVSGIKNKTYNGKAQTQSIKIKEGSYVLKKGTDYTISYKNNKNAGKAAITIKGKGAYSGTIKKTFKINKAANPIKVTAKKSVTAKADEKTTIKKAITVKKAQGKVTYKTNNKKVTVKNGTMTVAKGLQKGKSFTVKVTITAKGNKNYKSKKIVKTIKINVK